MEKKPVIIIAGEPFSVFLEILFKLNKSKFIKKYNRPIILIVSEKLLKLQMKKLGYSFKINLIHKNKIEKVKLYNNKLNIINVNFNFKKAFDKITSKSKGYIEECFNIGLKLIKDNKGLAMINGPISKKHFLNKKYFGITEYLSNKTKKYGKEVMLIYNKALSVSPITTHVPLKSVHKHLSKNKIINNIKTISKFYNKKLIKNPKFAVTGFNPHCESTFSPNEESKIIKPAIQSLKNLRYNIDGPFPADTIFSKNKIKKYDVIIGMYHDQVLAPIKALYGFNAINITLGLPFIRVSPDHGPNHEMLGMNKSNPKSLKESLKFINKVSDN